MGQSRQGGRDWAEEWQKQCRCGVSTTEDLWNGGERTSEAGVTEAGRADKKPPAVTHLRRVHSF